jgi:hypothetical protein
MNFICSRLSLAKFLPLSLLAAGGVALSAPESKTIADEKEKAVVKPLRALLITGGCCHEYGKQ